MSNGACDFPTVFHLDNPDGADEAFNIMTGEGEASSVVLMKLNRTILKMLSAKSSAKSGFHMWKVSRSVHMKSEAQYISKLGNIENLNATQLLLCSMGKVQIFCAV